jgi:hypothetical protein
MTPFENFNNPGTWFSAQLSKENVRFRRLLQSAAAASSGTKIKESANLIECK